MIEYAFRGSLKYWAWITVLLALSSLALLMFILQQREGLGITAMSRDVPWGFYIAQLTFLVGVAASAVMVVLPYYLHDFKAFGRVVILGEFLAIPAVLLCPLFVAVDLGQPLRVLNLFLHPSPRSLLFWDTIALLGYLLLNIVIGWKTLAAERSQVAPPKWVRLLILVSIPWAVSIHTVTAFLYCGLSARPFWFTAVLTPRFLASAFASGPSLLILLCFIVRRFAGFDPGERAIKTLARIVTYALSINLFLFGTELFTTMYSGQEHHILHLRYLFTRVDGVLSPVVPFMWASMIMAVAALFLLLFPSSRKRDSTLITACVLVFLSIWIDKGAGMLSGGFTPTTFGRYAPYFPSVVEVLLGIGLYSFGALVLTVLYKMAITIKTASGPNNTVSSSAASGEVAAQ